MFRFIFKKSNITVTIYKEHCFSEEKKQQIIFDYHNTSVGRHFEIPRTIKRLKMNYQWKNLKQDVIEVKIKIVIYAITRPFIPRPILYTVWISIWAKTKYSCNFPTKT